MLGAPRPASSAWRGAGEARRDGRRRARRRARPPRRRPRRWPAAASARASTTKRPPASLAVGRRRRRRCVGEWSCDHASGCPTVRPSELAAGATGRSSSPPSIGRRLAKAAVAAVVDGDRVDLGTAAARRRRGGGRHRGQRRRAGPCCATRPRTCWPRPCSSCGPGAHYAIGPPIEDGFYYDFELPGGATLQRRRPRPHRGRRCGRSWPRTSPSSARSTPIDEGLALFADQPFKREIIEGVGAGRRRAVGRGRPTSRPRPRR